jgi:hypothetical protein
LPVVATNRSSHATVAGLDPAFNRDPFGVAIIGRAADGRLVCGPIWNVHARGAFEGPIDEIAAELKRYGVRRVVSDEFCQAPVLERLRHKHGLDAKVHTMTPQTKTAIFQGLRLSLYNDSQPLPDHPDLINELRRLRTKYTAGSAAVMNPRGAGSHGDMAQALALAVHEVSSVPDYTNFIERSQFGMFAAAPTKSKWILDQNADAAPRGVMGRYQPAANFTQEEQELLARLQELQDKQEPYQPRGWSRWSDFSFNGRYGY